MTDSNIICSPSKYQTASIGTKTITLSYGNSKAIFDINVIADVNGNYDVIFEEVFNDDVDGIGVYVEVENLEESSLYYVWSEDPNNPGSEIYEATFDPDVDELFSYENVDGTSWRYDNSNEMY